MTSRSFVVAACTTVLTVASSSSMAQEATLSDAEMHRYYGVTDAAAVVLAQPVAAAIAPPDAQPHRVVITARGLTVRERVVAELMDAIGDGTLDRSGEAQQFAQNETPLVFTRAEVVAELFKAKAEGRFDSSGEHWIGHDYGGRDPSVTLVSASRLTLIAQASRR